MKPPMRILALNPFTAYGGSTKSLVETFTALDPTRVQTAALVAAGVPDKNWFPPQTDLIETSGISQWDNTRFGYYRGLRWLIALREILRLPATIMTVRRLKNAGSVDIVHCNDVTLLPTAIMAKRMLGSAMVVHVRSLQAAGATPRRTRLFTRLLQRHADAIVAIDEAVARTLDDSLAVEVIHNGMDVPDYHPRPDTEVTPVTIGIIGSLSVSKAALEAVQACAELKRRGVPFKMLVAGENVRELSGVSGWALKKLNFSRDIAAEIREVITQNDMYDQVQMLGFVTDVHSIYRQLDILCFPSRFDAPGRPVFEAALHGVPSIVAMADPTTDVIVHGETGLSIAGQDPTVIADALETLITDRPGARDMGHKARALAVARFDRQVTAAKLTQMFETVMETRA